MLINIKTNNGNVIINTDKIDGMFFNRSENKLSIYFHGQSDLVNYFMKESLIDDAIEKINNVINKQKTNID